MFKIFIDADACPVKIKDIIFKACKKNGIQCLVVANCILRLPLHPLITLIKVDNGFDKADDYIAAHVEAQDLVITQDLPLADDCLVKKANVLSPRGELYTLSTIKSKLAMRDFNETMRASGIHTNQQNIAADMLIKDHILLLQN